MNLRYLDLSYNNISDIAPEAFKYLKNLHTLVIRRNSLSLVSDWTLPLSGLVSLDISQNCLVRLSSSLSLSQPSPVSLRPNTEASLAPCDRATMEQSWDQAWQCRPPPTPNWWTASAILAVEDCQSLSVVL